MNAEHGTDPAPRPGASTGEAALSDRGDLGRRLADALQTTPAELLGGRLDGLLTPGGVGRVAVTTALGPAVFPVNFIMAGRTIVFRTSAGDVLAANGDGPVAVEVDHLDEALAQGWSVLAQGNAHRVTDPAELDWVNKSAAVWPWAGGGRQAYVRVIPERITGRRILDG
jgi:hypothetical protein